MESLKGRLLIAGAGIAGEIFRQTVILLAEHDENGALGFVLNRPSRSLIEEIVPSLELPAAIDERFYLGGPVQPEIVAILAEFEDPADAPKIVFGSIGFAPADDPAAGRITRGRAFAGYAGWGPGQLEGEMEEGGWLVETPTPDDVFTPDPETLWRNVVRRKGGEFTLLSTMPFDPSSN